MEDAEMELPEKQGAISLVMATVATKDDAVKISQASHWPTSPLGPLGSRKAQEAKK